MGRLVMVFAIIVATIAFPAPVEAAVAINSGVQLTLNPDGKNITIGEIVDVEVKAHSGVTVVGALQVALKINPQVVRVVDMDQSAAGVQPQVGNCGLDDFQIAIETAPGEIKYFGGLLVGGKQLYHCTAFKLRLEGISNGSSPIQFDSDWTRAYSDTNVRVPIAWSNGYVNVVNPTILSVQSKRTLKIGETTDIKIRVNSNREGISATQIFFEYDPQILRVIDRDPELPGPQPAIGNCALGQEIVNTPRPGDTRYVAVQLLPKQLDCTAMIITVQALQPGVSYLRYNTAQYKTLFGDFWGVEMPFKATASQITVEKPKGEKGRSNVRTNK